MTKRTKLIIEDLPDDATEEEVAQAIKDKYPDARVYKMEERGIGIYAKDGEVE